MSNVAGTWELGCEGSGFVGPQDPGGGSVWEQHLGAEGWDPAPQPSPIPVEITWDSPLIGWADLLL